MSTKKIVDWQALLDRIQALENRIQMLEALLAVASRPLLTVSPNNPGIPSNPYISPWIGDPSPFTTTTGTGSI